MCGCGRRRNFASSSADGWMRRAAEADLSGRRVKARALERGSRRSDIRLHKAQTTLDGTMNCRLYSVAEPAIARKASPQEMAFDPGQKIGDYEVIAKLGAGGLGAVYEVQHRISKRREAMKILLPDQSAAPEMVERFHREVQTLATLNHVNIAALHTAFYNDNQLAMVMELIPGETLRDRHAKGPIAIPQALAFAAQVLQALIYAHRLGVVHRDIKP